MRYCEEYAALLDPFVDGELPAETASRVQDHLELCSGCRSYVQAALLMKDAFPAAEDVDVPDGFTEGVMAAIRANAAPQKKRKAPWINVLLPLAACCAVVVLVRSALPFSGNGNTAAVSAAVETAEDAAAGDTMERMVSEADAPAEGQADEVQGKVHTAPNSPALYSAAGISGDADGGTALVENGVGEASASYGGYPDNVESTDSADGSINAAAKDGDSTPQNSASPSMQDSAALSGYFAELFLTEAQAGTLLEAYTTPETPVVYNSDSGLTETTYELTRAQFDTLLSQLSETVPYTENDGGDLAKVIVTSTAGG